MWLSSLNGQILHSLSELVSGLNQVIDITVVLDCMYAEIDKMGSQNHTCVLKCYSCLMI